MKPLYCRGTCLNADVSDGRLPARRRWVRWAIGAVVTLLILAVGWVVVRGAGAVSELRNVEQSAAQLRTSIAAGDLSRVSLVAPRLSNHAASARSLTSDPIWRAFEIVPWVGTNFIAMREVAEIADDVAADAIAAVLAVSADLDLSTLGFTGSKIDLVAFAKIEESLADATKKLAAADLQAQQINADGVIGPMTDAVDEMRGAIAETSTAIGALHGAALLLHPMLGADGPRNYVVVIQNNADVRSSGGSIDSLTLFHAENGTISIARQASANDFPPLAEPLALSDSVVALFEDRPGRSIGDITSIPDFSEAGATIAARWEQKFGGTVDGVIALDAVVAQHLLEATGAVAFGAYTANSETILPILLSTLYTDVADTAQQHAVFAQAAQALFAAALASGEPQQLIGALSSAADEGRIHVWSAHPEEQEILAASTLGGLLPNDGQRGSYVGVLFNDLTGGKMNFYTSATISTAIGTCQGEPTTQVQVTWSNNAPVGGEEPLPATVTGPESEGMSQGDVRTLITIYGPEGATVRDSESDAESIALGARYAVQQEVVVAPGEAATVTVSFTGEGAGEKLTKVQHTPLRDAVAPTRSELICD